MKTQSTPVVIAGAGPVGLSLALGLARQGIRTIVVEQNPALSEFSKAAVVLPRTLEIFDAWGVIDAFKEVGRWLERVQVCDKSNKPLFKIHLDILADESPTPAVCLIAQNDTERLLHAALMASGMSEVRFNNRLVSFEETGQEVLSRISAPDSEYTMSSRYLCGCDGPRSAVRSQLGMELDGKTYNAHALLADIKTRADIPGDPPLRVDLDSWGLNAMINFKPRVWRLVLALPGKEPASVPLDQIHERVGTIIGTTDFDILWSSTFKIHCRNAPRNRIGKIVLLGDAAHLNSPAGGQGMNAGIQDAYNLTWKLAAILNGGNEAELLASYESERQDAIRNGVDVFTDRLTRVAISLRPTAKQLIVKVFALLLRWNRFARAVARGAGMLSFRYAPGPLIDDSGGALYEDRRTSSARGRILKPGKDYIVVRPDDVVAYRGSDRARAEELLSRVFSGPIG